ncbi:MAG TPA: hypothetical protein ENK18_27230 [Deltaproteobacteria bacterium]|nr:hypothetical protein [Deltaproteobacteria bacterium]
MFWILAINTATATDLHITLSTSEGLQESWTKPAVEATTRSIGPVLGRGKRQVTYNVTLQPSVFDPLSNGFETDLSLCRTWVKKDQRDRDCVSDLVLVPSETSGSLTLESKIKSNDKFSFTIELHYVGPPPVPIGLPGAPGDTSDTEEE